MSGILQALIGASGANYTVDAQNMIAIDTALDPANATAIIAIDAAGAVTATPGTDFQLVTLGAVADLEIVITGSGDTPTGSAVGSAVALGGAVSWTLSQTVPGEKEFTGTYQIRVIATAQVLGGAAFNLTAHVDV